VESLRREKGGLSCRGGSRLLGGEKGEKRSSENFKTKKGFPESLVGRDGLLGVEGAGAGGGGIILRNVSEL